ncbi:hypothetical protein MHYP_G00242310 [Metynnis hypsauchen]
MSDLQRSSAQPQSDPVRTSEPVKDAHKDVLKGLDVVYGRYSGDSFLEFEGIDLGAVNNITVRFQTWSWNGTLLYVDQGRVRRGFFFIKLHLLNGTLQYDFSCNQEEGIRKINTNIQVNDGNEYLVHVRQHLAPCEAEVTVSGFQRVRSVPSNYWSGLTVQMTGHVFIGGLPLSHPPYKGAEPLYNYTGCIEIIEINKLRRFRTSTAITASNVDNCSRSSLSALSVRLKNSICRMLTSTDRLAFEPFTGLHSVASACLAHRSILWSMWYQDTPVGTVAPPPVSSPFETTPNGADIITPLSSAPPPACSDGPCRNGGTCRPLSLPSGAAAFLCDCPLHFTGRLCEKGRPLLSLWLPC